MNNKKYFCVNCGHHIYLKEPRSICPECGDTDSLTEVKA